jgi:hypothetical protein
MKRIISFAGIIIAMLILLAVTYLKQEPTTAGKIFTVLGSVLGIVSFAVWVRS